MKIGGVTDYTNKTPFKHFRLKKCLSSIALKIRKHLSNVHKKKRHNVQCMNSHYAKSEH